MRKKIRHRIDENLAACLAARRKIVRECKTREGFYEYLFRLEQEEWPPPPPLPARKFSAGAKPRKARTVMPMTERRPNAR
ncbi:MAG: hypothetical protein ABSE73_21175 [Planctomycetota bacterium]